MIKIYVYNLTTFEIKEVIVDEIVGGKAKIIRLPNIKELNNKTYTLFKMKRSEAEETLRLHLEAEIIKRAQRLAPVITRHNELCTKRSQQFTFIDRIEQL